MKQQLKNGDIEMASVKAIVMTAIKYKGIATVRATAEDLAEKALCTKAYILSLVRKVEKGEIIVM